MWGALPATRWIMQPSPCQLLVRGGARQPWASNVLALKTTTCPKLLPPLLAPHTCRARHGYPLTQAQRYVFQGVVFNHPIGEVVQMEGGRRWVVGTTNVATVVLNANGTLVTAYPVPASPAQAAQAPGMDTTLRDLPIGGANGAEGAS